MTINERISSFFAKIKSVFSSLASGAVEIAPVAEAIEAVVAPQTVAPTEAAAAVAEKIEQATKD